jgi:hypothetical protein
MFGKLALCATSLNDASDGLGVHVSQFDVALQTLNLGISTWIAIPGGWEEPDGSYCDWELGYDKINRRWGIALRALHGMRREGEVGSAEEWLFNDDPRAMRVQAVDKLPDLLRALCRKADDVTAEIEQKAMRAEQFVKGAQKLAGKKR